MVPESVSHFIGGRQARSALGKTYRVPDPATGKDYAQVEVGTAGDVISLCGIDGRSRATLSIGKSRP